MSAARADSGVGGGVGAGGARRFLALRLERVRMVLVSVRRSRVGERSGKERDGGHFEDF